MEGLSDVLFKAVNIYIIYYIFRQNYKMQKRAFSLTGKKLLIERLFSAGLLTELQEYLIESNRLIQVWGRSVPESAKDLKGRQELIRNFREKRKLLTHNYIDPIILLDIRFKICKEHLFEVEDIVTNAIGNLSVSDQPEISNPAEKKFEEVRDKLWTALFNGVNASCI